MGKWDFSHEDFLAPRHQAHSDYSLSGHKQRKTRWTWILYWGRGRQDGPDWACVDLKRCTTWKLWVKFYLGQKEDCSPGDSTSKALRNCSKEIAGKDSIYVILVKGEYMRPRISFFVESFSWKDLMKLLLVMRNNRHHEGFSVFLDLRRYKNWTHKISSWEYLPV